MAGSEGTCHELAKSVPVVTILDEIPKVSGIGRENKLPTECNLPETPTPVVAGAEPDGILVLPIEQSCLNRGQLEVADPDAWNFSTSWNLNVSNDLRRKTGFGPSGSAVIGALLATYFIIVLKRDARTTQLRTGVMVVT
jgi:hypothetical protein